MCMAFMYAEVTHVSLKRKRLNCTRTWKALDYPVIMASRNIWRVRRNFLFDLRGWVPQYSAEVFLKSISFRPFSVECDSKDGESLENGDLLINGSWSRHGRGHLEFYEWAGAEDVPSIQRASDKVIGSIISRYPRAITRTPERLSKRWDLWREIMASDLEIVNSLECSPESFFLSNNNLNLENNIKFLCSVGLTHKCLCRLLTSAPRTFSNSLNLNKQMVEYLQETSISLRHNVPTNFCLEGN